LQVLGQIGENHWGRFAAHRRQGDVQLKNRATALVFQLDMHIIAADVHILADHLEQLFLQGRQVVRFAALAALVRHDDL